MEVVQMGVVQMGVVQLGVVQLGVVQMGVDLTATVIIEMDGNKQMVKNEKTFSDFSSPIPSSTLPS